MPYPLAACRNRNFGVPAIVNPLASVPWVAQWKFNNNGNDSIGANHLTANNSPTFTTGKLGGATGATQLVATSSQYWSIADNAALSMGDVDFTICAWVYFDSTNAIPMGIVGKWNAATGQREYVLYRRGGTPDQKIEFIVSADGGTTTLGQATWASASANGVWYLVVGWHDSIANTVNLQINNGTIVSVVYSAGVFNGAAGFSVGSFDGASSYQNGRIDNVCIAKSAPGGGGVLTAAQRTAFYAAGVGTEQIT